MTWKIFSISKYINFMYMNFIRGKIGMKFSHWQLETFQRLYQDFFTNILIYIDLCSSNFSSVEALSSLSYFLPSFFECLHNCRQAQWFPSRRTWVWTSNWCPDIQVGQTHIFDAFWNPLAPNESTQHYNSLIHKKVEVRRIYNFKADMKRITSWII